MDFIKNPQTTIALTLLTHIISNIDGVCSMQYATAGKNTKMWAKGKLSFNLTTPLH